MRPPASRTARPDARLLSLELEAEATADAERAKRAEVYSLTPTRRLGVILAPPRATGGGLTPRPPEQTKQLGLEPSARFARSASAFALPPFALTLLPAVVGEGLV